MSAKLPLVVIGAGPKAAALAAKSKVIRDHYPGSVPDIWVIDNKDLAANWFGKHGFTSGSQRLGTPPEKDIGFPYRPDSQDRSITSDLFSRYSWPAYVIKGDDYGEWIDRGRIHPTHKEWAQYIASVIKDTATEIRLNHQILSIEQEEEEWNIIIRKDASEENIRAQGIVMTGPGERKSPSFTIPHHERILFGDNFWQHTSVFDRLEYNNDQPILVVGGGETAASILVYILDRVGKERIPVLALTRSGTIFSRGEGYYENRMFTDDEIWPGLPKNVRKDIIKRGDRGVFSIDAVKRLSYSRDVEHMFKEVTNVAVSRWDKNVIIVNQGVDDIECQLLIFALGFDPFWFGKLMAGSLRDIFSNVDSQMEIENSISKDLSVNHRMLTAKLYLPMIAGFAQGPGFPNLSCLGTLSDRILLRTST